MLIALLISTAFAQSHGIMPGEPDPNLSPKTDEIHGTIDDRKPCKKGERRFQKLECGKSKEQPECDHYTPVMECHKKAPQLKCKKPLVLVPLYRCEP
jgi:hypothetical protein